jgi:hypothetical protein
MNEAEMIYKEMHAVIRRWIQEGDALQAFAVIGALEAVKADYMETLKRHNTERRKAADEDAS